MKADLKEEWSVGSTEQWTAELWVYRRADLRAPSRVERKAATKELVRAGGTAVQMVRMRAQMRADSKAVTKAELTGVSRAEPKVSQKVE